jgi:chromosome segregation protein
MTQLISRKKTIEEMEANYEGYNYGVKYLMKNNIPGLYGTVAELIQVPRGFEIAMETALGGNLQNIVCQKDQDAEKAIELLKENRAGRLTFLPLASIKKSSFRRDPSISEAKGFKGFAADLVTTKDAYVDVMEYLLGKVAVFDNMQNAISLSKSLGGYRCVTLEGEFINANGAITGGRHKNNSANLLERKGEIESLGKQYDEMETQAFVLEKDRIELVGELEKSLESGLEQEQLLKDAEMAYLTKKSHDDAYVENLTAMNLRKEARLLEQENIEEEIAQSDRMVLELLKAAKTAEESAQEIEREIESALLNHQDKKIQLDEAVEGITKLRMSKSSWESEKQGIDAILTIIQSNMEEMKREVSEKEARLSGYDREKQEILGGSGSNIKLVQEKEEKKVKIEEQLKAIRLEKSDVFQKLTQVSHEKESLDTRLENLSSSRMEMEIRKGKNETLLDTYKEKLWEEFEISYIQAIEFRKEGFALSTALRENREIRSRIKDLGEVNVGAIPEYQEVSERYEFLTDQRKDILDATDALNKIIRDTDKIIKARFKESFDQVASNFEMFFSELFGGGNAQLVLEDSDHPLESNIDIVAQPPGKKLSNISLLSGGEKTMTAIALMFAVLKTKPTPFCILDEVEAALDETNINRFIKTLHHFDDEIQFTLVTHQKATMEHADTLYGITMAEQGVSKVLSLKLGDAFDLGEN